MAIGVVILTRRKRYILSLTVVAFLLSQSVLGMVTVIWSIYLCFSLCPTLYSEKSEVTFVFTVTGMYGTHVLFNNLTGLKICHNSYLKTYKKSTRNLLFFWTLAECNTLINIIILAGLAPKISKHMVRTVRHSLERGMRNYLTDPYWKHTMDILQMKLHCCGVTSYKDWYDISWLNEFRLNLEDEGVRSLRSSKVGTHLPVTPWSCCDITFPMQCFHDPLQQVESRYLWKEEPMVMLDSIYNDGCLLTIRTPIENALVGFILITFSIAVLQLVTIIMLRLLYTSSRNAILLGNEGGAAPGWIFGRGDCGWNRGAGLDEIMMSCNLPSDARQGSSGHSHQRRSMADRSEEEPIGTDDEAALMLQ